MLKRLKVLKNIKRSTARQSSRVSRPAQVGFTVLGQGTQLVNTLPNQPLILIHSLPVNDKQRRLNKDRVGKVMLTLCTQRAPSQNNAFIGHWNWREPLDNWLPHTLLVKCSETCLPLSKTCHLTVPQKAKPCLQIREKKVDPELRTHHLVDEASYAHWSNYRGVVRRVSQFSRPQVWR